jgi:hypothetical protein
MTRSPDLVSKILSQASCVAVGDWGVRRKKPLVDGCAATALDLGGDATSATRRVLHIPLAMKFKAKGKAEWC